MADPGSTAETIESPRQADSLVAYWDEELKAYERAAKKWDALSKRIVDRFMLRGDEGVGDDGRSMTKEARYNVLWSNFKVQLPSIFARSPVPVVERRFIDDVDAVGRLSAKTVERMLVNDLEEDDPEDVFSAVATDLLLCGRGVPWVRYDPTIDRTELQVWPGVEGGFVDGEGESVETSGVKEKDGRYTYIREEVVEEHAPIEYVFWRDFLHKPCKSWRELEHNGWVCRRTWMTRAEGVRRFGDIFHKVPLESRPEYMKDELPEGVASVVKLGEIYEIWDASSREVFWIARNFDGGPLDRQPDPLHLRRFFPCPPPIYSTLATDSLIPTPDYQQYESLAMELDEVTHRISLLLKAVAVKGLYDNSLSGLGNLLQGAENTMVPVPGLAARLSATGGRADIGAVIQFLPIDVITKALDILYIAREQIKATLFEVTGIADIVRGHVNPREKLGQSQLKGEATNRRTRPRQNRMSRLVKQTLGIKAEIMAEHFDPAQIRRMSAFDYIPEVVQARANNPAAPDKMFAQVMELIASDRLRDFRIDVETDSTIEIDEERAKGARIEFLRALGPFMEKTIPVAGSDPKLGTVLMEALLWLTKGFRAGRGMESSLEQLVQMAREAAKQPQQPQPNPEEKKAQAEIKVLEQRSEIEIAALEKKTQIEIQGQREQAALKQQTMQTQFEIKLAEANLDERKLALEERAVGIKERSLLVQEKLVGIKEREAAAKATDAGRSNQEG